MDRAFGLMEEAFTAAVERDDGDPVYAALLERMRKLSGEPKDRVRTCLPDRRGDLRWAAKLLASGAPA